MEISKLLILNANPNTVRVRILVFLCLSFLSTSLLAQWSIGGEPKSFDLLELKSVEVPSMKTSVPDLNVLAEQDELDRLDNIPPRFGMPYKASIDMNVDGQWAEIEGGAIWRMGIESPGAQTINLNYSDFYMPHGATFHIYSADHKNVIGAFTEVNNKKSGKFATGFIKSDAIVLEVFVPDAVRAEARLVVSEVVYGYRSLAYLSNEAKDFGDSASCMINVNCPAGDDWDDAKKSVGLIMTAGNFRFCTGSLINNSAGNCTAYFLTAEHCMGGQSSAQIETSLVIFNYLTPECQNPDLEPDFSQNVQGVRILSSAVPSDFSLWELDENPALAPNISGGVFFAGWDRNDSPSERTIALHHPAGDVMKISIDEQAPISNQWQANQSGTHWLVSWNDGITAGGSSGGPLYNERGQIIGQLTGGGSFCSNPTAPDLYGKMARNWDSDTGVNDSGLRQFLDVFDENMFSMDGQTCGEYAVDASLEILNPTEVGCDEIVPVLEVRNNGTTPLNLVGVQLKLNGEIVQNKVITDEISSFSTVALAFDAIPAPPGINNTLLACFINVNGSTDEDVSNDCTAVIVGCESLFPAGIEELRDISIYPNPSQGQLFLNGITEPTELSLFSTDGKLVYEGFVTDNQSIDLSGFQAGLYVLRMQQGDEFVLRKVGLVD